MRFKHLARPWSRFFESVRTPARAAEDPIAAPDSAATKSIAASAAKSPDAAVRVATADDRSALPAVADSSADSARLSSLLAAIDDPRQIAALAVDGSSSRLRRLAAQQVQDPETLKQLARQLRGKDNGVYKIVKQKCDALRAEAERAARIEGEAAALCASLEAHARRIPDAQYAATLHALEARWTVQRLPSAGNLPDRAQRALERCRELAADHERQAAAEAAERAADEAQRAAERAAREAALAAAAEAQARDKAEALAAAQAAAIRDAERRRREEQAATDALFLRRLGGLIRGAQSAVHEGNSRRAAGLRRAIDDMLRPAADSPPVPSRATAAQLQELDARLGELREWKEYAVAPKRAALLREMESLQGSTEEPYALAERIRRLREDWQTTGRGIDGDAGEDWQRFDAAAERAFEPCREHFAAQAERRQRNLEQRHLILERLRAFEAAQSDGAGGDVRAIAAVLREAPLEWRRHSPVDRAEGRLARGAFDEMLGRLKQRLDERQAGHAAEKESLIERARSLAARAEGDEALAEVKRLQLQWQATAPAAREQEQRLWSEFRAHCDAVFEQRRRSQAERAAAWEANRQQALALCGQAEELASLSGAALREGVTRIAEWRAAFDALSGLPKAGEREIRARFEGAVGRAASRLERQRSQERERSFADLLEAARRIHAYGRARDDEACALLREDAERFIAAVEQWPKGAADSLRQAWTRADAAAGGATAAGSSATSDTAAGGTTAVGAADAATAAGAARVVTAATAAAPALADDRTLRLLCIRAEILADRATPPEDQALRREHQMQRLARVMGQGGQAPADGFDELALEWVRSAPVATQHYESLLARFANCCPT